MKNHIGRTLLVLILLIHSLTSLASSQSKYTPLIRQVRGWPSEKILSKGDQFLQNKKEDKALVMYMLVCSRTNDRMTDEELTDCSLANLKVGDIFYARGNYINALESYQEGLKLSETSASKTHLPLIYKNIGNVYCMFKDYGKGFDYYKKAYQIRPKPTTNSRSGSWPTSLAYASTAKTSKAQRNTASSCLPPLAPTSPSTSSFSRSPPP